MSQHIRIFVNEHAAEVEAGSSVRAGVRAHDAALAAALDHPGTYVTDGVGRRLDPDSALMAGAILRVVVSARRADERSE